MYREKAGLLESARHGSYVWTLAAMEEGQDYPHDLQSMRYSNHKINTHSAKYQAPITLAVVDLKIPLPTPQLHSQTATVPTIAQLAQPCTCHSTLELFDDGQYPINNNLNMRVRNGIEPTSEARSIAGDRAKRNGLAIRRRVVSVRTDEVVWI